MNNKSFTYNWTSTNSTNLTNYKTTYSSSTITVSVSWYDTGSTNRITYVKPKLVKIVKNPIVHLDRYMNRVLISYEYRHYDTDQFIEKNEEFKLDIIDPKVYEYLYELVLELRQDSTKFIKLIKKKKVESYLMEAFL